MNTYYFKKSHYKDTPQASTTMCLILSSSTETTQSLKYPPIMNLMVTRAKDTTRDSLGSRAVQPGDLCVGAERELRKGGREGLVGR